MDAAVEFVEGRFGPVAYHKLGRGPVLVLFHGGSGSANHWTNNMHAFAQKRTVLAFDLPGFGRSAAPARDVAVVDYLDELARLTDQVVSSEGTFSLAGFSFGAVCAAEVGVRLGRVIESTVLVAPGGFGPLPADLLAVKRIPLREPFSEESRKAAAYNLGKLMLHHAPSPDSEVVSLHLQNILRTRFDSHRISFQNNIASLVERLSGHLLAIWGACDLLVGSGGVAARSDAINIARPSSERVILPKAGHWIMQDVPELFNNTVLSFLGRGTAS